MKDLTIVMDEQIGRPADILADLAEHEIFIGAGCLFPRLGGRVAHMAVADEDVDEVTSIIQSHGGMVADTRECIVVPADYDGGAPAASRAVADAGIAVQIGYFSARGELVLGTRDVAAAKAALGLD